jgi:hypothetical protein
LSDRRNLAATALRYIGCVSSPTHPFDLMPHSTTDSNYTTSKLLVRPIRVYDTRLDRSRFESFDSPISEQTQSETQRQTAQTQAEIPGTGVLLGILSEHGNTPSQRSSLCIAHSYTDPVNEGDFQKETPPRVMGGSRTGISMNGGLDTKRRTTSYDEQYQYKDNIYSTARERIHRESPVIAELRTNVIVSVDVVVCYPCSTND